MEKIYTAPAVIKGNETAQVERCIFPKSNRDMLVETLAMQSGALNMVRREIADLEEIESLKGSLSSEQQRRLDDLREKESSLEAAIDETLEELDTGK